MPVNSHKNNVKNDKSQSEKNVAWVDVLNRWLRDISKIMNCEHQSKYK